MILVLFEIIKNFVFAILCSILAAGFFTVAGLSAYILYAILPRKPKKKEEKRQ